MCKKSNFKKSIYDELILELKNIPDAVYKNFYMIDNGTFLDIEKNTYKYYSTEEFNFMVYAYYGDYSNMYNDDIYSSNFNIRCRRTKTIPYTPVDIVKKVNKKFIFLKGDNKIGKK